MTLFPFNLYLLRFGEHSWLRLARFRFGANGLTGRAWLMIRAP